MKRIDIFSNKSTDLFTVTATSDGGCLFTGRYRENAIDVAFIAKYHPNGEFISVPIVHLQTPQPVRVFPNPAIDIVTIESPNVIKKVELFDFSGKSIKTLQFLTGELHVQVELKNLSSGMYLFHIYTKEGTSVQKVFKK